jgi:exonuclease SbcC
MKFIKLEIKNIASIGEATINFDSAPLATEPLFLICGATGSGKSTILDAICLALYNTAPRLEGYGLEDYEDKSIDKSDKVRIGNPCQLIRRNANEAYSRLTFIGNDNRHYVASWHATRGVRSGKLNLGCSLECKESGITITGRNDFNEKVTATDVVGLKFDEFCRTTLLAQGAFTRFLNSKGNEKSNILEKLTGTEIYSKISKYIFDTFSSKKSLYEEKLRKIESYKLLSAEEREAKNILLMEEEKKICELKKAFDEIEKKLTWLDNYVIYSNEAKKAEELLNEIRNEKESPEIAQEKQLLKDWKATEEVRHIYTLLERLKLEGENHKRKKEELQERHSLLVHSSRTIGETRENICNEQKELEKRLTNAEKDIPMYENANALIVQMQGLSRKGSEEKKISSAIVENEKTLQHINTSLEKLTAERECHEKAMKEKLEEHKIAADELQRQPSAEETAKRKETIEKLASALKDVELSEERARAQHEKISTLKGELEKAQSEEKRIDGEKNKADEERKRQEELYEEMHLRIDDHAKALRAKLRSGDKCPICGETINHLLGDEEILKLMQPIKEAKENAVKKYEEIATQHNKVVISIKSYMELCEDAAKQLAAENETRNHLVALLDDACVQCNVTTLERGKLHKIIEDERNNISTLQQTYAILTAKLVAISNEKDNITRALNEFMKTYSDVTAEQKKTTDRIEIYRQQLNTCRKDIESLRDELNNSITLNDWESNIEESITTLQQRAAAYQRAKEKNEQAKTKIKQLDELEQRIENHRSNTSEFFAESLTMPVHTQAIPIEKLEEEWVQFANNSILLKDKMERSCKEAEEYAMFIERFMQENPQITKEKICILATYNNSSIEECEKRVNKLETEYENAKTLVADRQKKFSDHMLQAPTLQEEESADYLKTEKGNIDKMRSEAENRVGAYKLELQQDADNSRLVEKERKEAGLFLAETDKWKSLSDIFGSHDGKKFKQITQSYILMQLLENANHYLRHFTTRYELTAQPGSLVILIVDKEESDASRPANTLSGGESFMVSLALALGLSSLNRNNFTPDTLFIDEGFGTLSGECLNTVVETLEVLHSMGNRRVGIISHVNELYERITTRIEINKRKGVSEVKIVG